MELKDIIAKLSTAVAVLDSGSAATLRRGVLQSLETGAFWKLMCSQFMEDYVEDQRLLHPSRKAELEKWGLIVRAIAVLTPKGSISSTNSAYDPKIPMGKAILDADFSELRLARLLAAPDTVLAENVIRLCRRLASSGHNRFNLTELAKFIL
ncbi:MAG: hypothetical protein K8963_04100, partial [Proteobacteria bacterium]|nr:hypothetical protein [Pseudomonadota bacterium]